MIRLHANRFPWILTVACIGLLGTALWLRQRISVPPSPAPTAEHAAVASGEIQSQPKEDLLPLEGRTGVFLDPKAPAPAEPAGLRASIALNPDNILRRNGNAYAYNSPWYGATAEKGNFRIAVASSNPGSPRPTLEFALEEVRLGDSPFARGGSQTPSPMPEALGLSYDRGSVEERYLFSPTSVEQVFVVNSLPDGTGDLTVVGKVSTPLATPADGSRGDRLSFRDGDAEAITVSEAVAVDAKGRRLPLELAYAENRLTVTVPEAWLQQATLPLVIDPAIGGAISLRSGIYDTGLVRGCDVAWNPTDNLWFAVWTESVGATQAMQISGQFIRPTGAPLGAPFAISATTDRDGDVCLSYAPAPVNRFLVTWSHSLLNDSTGTSSTIEGRILSGTGTFVTAPFTVDDRSMGDNTPRSAFDGTNWYVAWNNTQPSSQTSTQVVGRFVSAAGVPGTKVDADQNVLVKSGGIVGVAFSNGVYVIAWCGGSAPNNPYTTYARTMTPSGVLSAAKAISAGGSFDLAASNGKFFIFGNLNVAPNTPWSYILDSSLNATAVTAVGGERLCRVGSLPGWYSVLPNSTQTGVQAYSITEGGAVSAAIAICTPGQYTFPDGADWAASTNELMVVYRTGPTIGSYRFEAQRFNVGTTILGTPSGLTGTAAASGITLKWSPATGATGFNVKRRTSSTGTYTTVATGVLDCSYTDTSVTGGSTYLYVVTATSGASESSPSNEVSVTAQSVLPAPTGLFTGFGNGFISVNWSAVTGATNYNVKRATTATGPFTTIATGVPYLTYTNTGLTPGSTFWYVVTAVNAQGESANSLAVSGTAYGPAGTPTGLTAAAGNNKVTLSWNVPVFVTGGYSVKRSTSSGGPFSPVISNWAQSTYTDATAINLTKYYYVVTAWGVTGETAPSSVVPATPMSTVPATPTGVVATSGNTTVSLSWNAVVGASSYSVQQSSPSSSGPYTTIATGLTSTSYKKTGLTNGTNYWYTVTAVDYLGSSPASTHVWGLPLPTPPSPPSSLTVNPQVLGVQLSWVGVTGATSYTIYRSDNGGNLYAACGTTTTALTFLDKNVIDGTTYYYTVTASVGTNESNGSNVVSAIPLHPSAPTVLFVVGNTTLGAGDAAVQSRLVQLGYSVVIKAATAATSTDAQGRALVLISSTVTSSQVSTTFVSAVVPIVTWENGLYGILGMTGTAATEHGTLTGQTQIAITNASSPMAAGLPAGAATITSTAQTVSWGKPNANAVKVASVSGDATRTVIFGYVTGAAMPGLAAPSRRVGFYLEDLTAGQWTPGGQGLFDAAVTWALNAPAAPLIVNTQESNGAVQVTWTSSPGAQSYNVLRATSPTGPFTLIATGLTTTTLLVSGLTNGTAYYFAIEAVNAAGGVSFATTPAQSTPTTGPVLCVGVLGHRFLKFHRSLDFLYDTKSYTAQAYVQNGGSFSLAQNAVFTWTSSKEGGGTYGIKMTRNGSSCTISPSGTNDSYDDSIEVPITLMVSATGVTTKFFKFNIKLAWRKELKVAFFFPSGSGQTARLGANGAANQFFSTNVTTRTNARNDWANMIASQTEDVLSQAGVGIYAVSNPDLKSWDSTYFDADGSGTATIDHKVGNRIVRWPSFQNLVDDDLKTDLIRVNIVKSGATLTEPGGILGVCMKNGGVPYGQSIILCDPDPSYPLDVSRWVLAHEFVHALNFLPTHITLNLQMVGPLNTLFTVQPVTPAMDMLSNPAAYYDTKNPRNIALMNYGLVNTYLDGISKRIGDPDCTTLFNNANTGHPARGDAR